MKTDNTNAKAELLKISNHCDGGKCKHYSHRTCMEQQSPHYGKRPYTRCQHFVEDDPGRNSKIFPGQNCANCRYGLANFLRYTVNHECDCWKNWSTRKKNNGTHCRNWQKEIPVSGPKVHLGCDQ